MKRFIFSLVALVIASVCFAQDIIVQKDGSTIQAKVLKMSQSEVEYKKYENLEGPTYTISTKDLICINYENGTKDTFVSSNYNPNIVTNETASQFSNDQQLLNIYNLKNNSKASQEYNSKIVKAKRLKTTAWVGGSIIAVGTCVLLACCSEIAEDSKDSRGHVDGATNWLLSGAAGIGCGAAWWACFYFPAKHIERKMAMLSIQSSPVFQQEFKVGKNDRLMVGVDILKDNMYKNRTLGLGFSYNF